MNDDFPTQTAITRNDYYFDCKDALIKAVNPKVSKATESDVCMFIDNHVPYLERQKSIDLTSPENAPNLRTELLLQDIDEFVEYMDQKDLLIIKPLWKRVLLNPLFLLLIGIAVIKGLARVFS